MTLSIVHYNFNFKTHFRVSNINDNDKKISEINVNDIMSLIKIAKILNLNQITFCER